MEKTWTNRKTGASIRKRPRQAKCAGPQGCSSPRDLHEPFRQVSAHPPAPHHDRRGRRGPVPVAGGRTVRRTGRRRARQRRQRRRARADGLHHRQPPPRAGARGADAGGPAVHGRPGAGRREEPVRLPGRPARPGREDDGRRRHRRGEHPRRVDGRPDDSHGGHLHRRRGLRLEQRLRRGLDDGARHVAAGPEPHRGTARARKARCTAPARWAA